jgi:ABC-type Fe3+-hydroxamate transport system substrate-binding protein
LSAAAKGGRDGPPLRLVSLCPSLTDTVFALGLGEALVGRTRFCVHPRPAVDAILRVGGTKNPRIDRIVALAPDLVLMNDEENRREDADALIGAGVPVWSSLPVDVPSTITMVHELGQRLGAAAAAGGLVAEIDAAEREVVSAAARRERPVRFAYLIWRDPLMVIGSGTYIEALLLRAGGQNVFRPSASADRYPTITPRDLAAQAPDVVLLASEPFPFQDRHGAELARETGLPPWRFRRCDGERLSWHGAKTPAGLRYAEALLSEAAAAPATFGDGAHST